LRYCFLFFNWSCQIGLIVSLLLFINLWCFYLFLIFLDLNILFFDLSYSWLILYCILSLFFSRCFNFGLFLLYFLLFVCLFLNFYRIFILNYFWNFFLGIFLYCLLVFLCRFYWWVTLSRVSRLFFLLMLNLLLFIFSFFLMLFQLLFRFNRFCFSLNLIFLCVNLWFYFFDFLLRLLLSFRGLLLFRYIFFCLFFFMFFFLW